MEIKKKADLHTHTNFSDGVFSPEKIVDMALKRGLSILSITDHDTFSGCKIAIDYSSDKDITVIPGVELSTYYDNREIHLLGYLFDFNNPDFNYLLEKMAEGRKHRAERICKRLSILGVEITIDDVLEQSKNSIIGRPHIASALVKKGAVRNFHEAFQKYLGLNSPVYVEKENLKFADAVDALSSAGGISIVAHPSTYDEPLLKKLIKAGVNGLEVTHPSLKSAKTRELKKIVKSFGLLESGGSDYHGGSRRDHSNFGSYFINSVHVDKMKSFLDTDL